MSQRSLSIKDYFRGVKDPRINRRKRHLLIDIIVIAVCGVICGADDWQAIETFAKLRHDWLKKFLRLPNGIPSHDTLERVFNLINPQAFQAGFRDWMLALHEMVGLKQIAIDGKTLCGSAGRGRRALHLVSAWATANHISLGQIAVEEKSNEIPAIPQLLETLDLHGALVTIDAMGCQKEIAAKIIDQGGDYVLTVKDNQPSLLTDVQQCLQRALDKDLAEMDCDEYETQEKGHGREEKRQYLVVRQPEGLKEQASWSGLQVIGMCRSERTVAGETSEEVRYFIGSKRASAKTYGQALRHHWGIENNLHWQLDVSFGEDSSRINNRNAAENFALLRKLALVLLKRHPAKLSIARKRLSAALDPTFLEETLSQGGDSGKI
jgi:predicted transposase YbfD/YdcC